MGLLDAIKGLFGGGGASGASSSGDQDGVYYYVKCDKCGEIVRFRANKRNDFNYEDGGPTSRLLRKEVMGSKRCYQLIRAELWVDANFSVVSADITGGELATEEAYEAQQAAEAVETAEPPPTESV